MIKHYRLPVYELQCQRDVCQTCGNFERKVYDLETGEPGKTTYRDGMLVIDEPMVVKRDEFRLLVFEAK